MQNNSKKAIEALGVLIQEIEPHNVKRHLESVFLGYVATDIYCQAAEYTRRDNLFLGKQVINFFADLFNDVKSDANQDMLDELLQEFSPSQVVNFWTEAVYAYMPSDAYCNQLESERCDIAFTIQLLLEFFTSLSQLTMAGFKLF